MKLSKLVSLIIPCIASAQVLVPDGPFPMGEILDGSLYVHTVYVSGFVMDTNLVTFGDYLDLARWATNNGYGPFKGTGKGAGHPVVNVTWYDAARWCNARSEQAGLKPCYWLTQNRVFRTGNLNPICNYSAAGFRLPTEAEWEKAAKGGRTGNRFPWGAEISQRQANYFGLIYWSYDDGPNGFNARYATAPKPYTNPVGVFAPNDLGLYDMAGNVNEWVGDWYSSSYYRVSPLIDPTGPVSGSQKMERGGSWNDYATVARCADRSIRNGPTHPATTTGFRCVRISLQ